MTAHPARWTSEVPDDAYGNGLALAVHTALSPSAVSPLSIMRRQCPEQDRRGPSAFAVRTLGVDAQPTRAARRFTRETLHGWGMDPLTDDVEVAATELVTNALRYGLAQHGHPMAPEPVWMSLVRQGSTVLCAVHDPGTAAPVVRDPDHLAESGRGLHVVASLSDSWGWTTPTRSGKAVWALFTLPRPSSGHSRLPGHDSVNGHR